VALKVAVRPGDKRFEREVTLLSRLHHERVPTLLDHGQWQCADRSFPYLVMQWVEGETLYKWSEARNPTSRQVLRLLAQVARALEATHEAGGVHRDVKGDNVLVRADGQAFLTDFGSSIYPGATPLTWEPLPPGTATYRSVEAWRHGITLRPRNVRYDAQPTDDLFALGITAYRLVTDSYPPSTDPDRMESDFWYFPDPSMHPPPPRTVNPRVDRQLSMLILRMLSVRPSDRTTAAALAKVLERRAEQAGPDADQPLFIWERLPPSAWPGGDAADARSIYHRRGHRSQAVVRATEQRELAEQSTAPHAPAPREPTPPPEPSQAPPQAPLPEPPQAPPPAPPLEASVSQEAPQPVPQSVPSTPGPPPPAVPATVPSEQAEERPHGLSVSAMVLLVAFGGWLLLRVSTAYEPTVAQADQGDAGTRDGGTVELGTEALSARVEETDVGDSRPGIHKDMPTKPLPGQRRPENTTGRCINPAQLALNGGCWTEFLNMKPPCQGDAYAWRGRCYEPVFTAPRQPTSTPD
jgi:serine/threonine protein kinase